MGKRLWLLPQICGHPGSRNAATPTPRRIIWAWPGGADQVFVGKSLSAVEPVLHNYGAEFDQFAHRPVDGVGRLLPHPRRQRRPGGHPPARGLAELLQHRVQPHCGVADVRVEQPLRNDREPVLNIERRPILKLRYRKLLRSGTARSVALDYSQDTDTTPPASHWFAAEEAVEEVRSASTS